MSLYKVPKAVLNSMESIRRNFFNSIQNDDKKITWVKWSKVLAAKKHGGLGVSSFFALNRALLFKWVWRSISQDNSLWFRFIRVVHGPQLQYRSPLSSSTWHAILREVNGLKSQGGIEAHQLNQLLELLGSVVLSNFLDRWDWDLNGIGVFCVKDVRNLLDEFFLPKGDIATRWIKQIPIKINVFAWRVFLDRLPTKLNLMCRGFHVGSLFCPSCNYSDEDVSHILFSFPLVVAVSQLVCRWWDVGWTSLGSYSEWLSWFNDIRLGSKVKCLFEGVLYVTWWCLWNFRNQSTFSAQKPRREVIFDDIVTRSFSWCSARCNSTFSWDS
uniref:RNA-directed DNA polymerase, eukaryota n=1 Tax=Tanacetum cinerariifolium TaxID=118510 RepID=A0A699I9T2_TANCI|nr:RNA-directed DNA polymerase, eukaryota [Tanacetum cinerariifolium]